MDPSKPKRPTNIPEHLIPNLSLDETDEESPETAATQTPVPKAPVPSPPPPTASPSADTPSLNVPDLSLGTPTEQGDPINTATTKHKTSSWKAGDRVLAPWDPTHLFVGTIVEVNKDQAHIEFDDGDQGWVNLEHINRLNLRPRQSVLARKKMGLTFYPGKVLEVEEDELLVEFEDGDKEWTTTAAIQIPCQPRGNGAKQTKVASHMAFLEHLEEGDRVWAPWTSDVLFVGTVYDIREEEILIDFDNGEQGWVLPNQLIPFEKPIGLRVLGRWKMRRDYYPGTITEVDCEGIHIVYDDGDKEWTTPAALALPCDPYGPNARPVTTTRRAVNLSANTGSGQSYWWILWVIFIGIKLLIVFSRCAGR
ncbi:MAG: hypothetical protein ACFCD0_03165 [Gemmataceae bacterium]